jgi:hypothetical protein
MGVQEIVKIFTINPTNIRSYACHPGSTLIPFWHFAWLLVRRPVKGGASGVCTDPARPDCYHKPFPCGSKPSYEIENPVE